MKRLIILCVSLLSFFFATAQDVKRPDTYNYNRGLDALNDRNYDEALQYFRKELSDNSSNGYAHAWVGLIYYVNEDYGMALTSYNKAIRHLPSKDKSFLASTYSSRSKIYLSIKDTASALKDVSTAIKICNDDDDLEDYYSSRAQIYYEMGKYDLADKDYQKILDINEGGVMGRMGLARNLIAQKQYEKAIKHLDQVLLMHSDYASGYAFRAEAYMGLRRYNEASSDIVSALDIDYDDKAFYLLSVIADSSFVSIVPKLRVKAIKQPSEVSWKYYLGLVHEEAERYTEAIDYYQQCANTDPDAALSQRIAVCYEEMGQYDDAIKFYTDAMLIDSSDSRYQYFRADAEYSAGRYDEALADMDAVINLHPDAGAFYYRRAWIKDHGTRDIQGAIDDYSMAITLMPQYPYSYLNRGVLHKLQGNNQDARNDFEEVLRLDTVERPYTCAQYAYLYLGNHAKAIEITDSMLASNRKENLYDAACVYSIMGEKKKAVGYLQEAFETGYRNVVHMQHDRDLDNIRDMEEYRSLVKQYSVSQNTITQPEAPVGRVVTSEIPFTRENGVCKVKCTINGLPLHMIFDTGADDITISSVEAAFMFKNGYLSKSDVVGRSNYMTASGDVVEGTVINLKSIEFGGATLSNVRASVVKGQRAPLLLGQSVLSRLGKIEIDNSKRLIRISHIEQ